MDTTIQEGNKLIANFDPKLRLDPEDPKKEVWDVVDPDNEDNNGWVELKDLEYHKNWNQILPITEKICSMGYTVQWTITDGSTCRIWAHRKDVQPCGVIITDRPFTAIVEFLTWHNTQQSNLKEQAIQ